MRRIFIDKSVLGETMPLGKDFVSNQPLALNNKPSQPQELANTSTSQTVGRTFEIQGDAFNHAINVLRFKINDEFQALAGDGYLYTCALQKIEKKKAIAQILNQKKLPELQAPHIELAICWTRLNTFEWILEKCVELGVHSIQPLASDFSFFKKATDIGENKLERLQKIILSATEQSVRGDIMQLKPTLTLENWLKTVDTRTPLLFAYEGAGGAIEASKGSSDVSKAVVSSKGAQSFLRQVAAEKPSQIIALCGSEGGFSLKEVQLLQRFNRFPVSMGQQILRAETACLALVSVIKYEFGHMGDLK